MKIIIRPFELLVSVFLIWYFTPVVGAVFSSDIFSLVFFGCYVLGVAGLIVFVNGKIRVNLLSVSVVIYAVCFVLMTLLGIGQASKHFRVGLVFLTVPILYCMVLNPNQRVRIGRMLLLLFIITSITSGLGVILNNRAARILSDASANEALQLSLQYQNIGSVYFFQCAVLFVPVVGAVFRNKPLYKVLVWALIAVVIMNASFTIALLVFAVAVMLDVFLNAVTQRSILGVAVIVAAFIALLAVLYAGDIILKSFISIIDNYKISARLNEIWEYLYSGRADAMAGGLASRFSLYWTSVQTFLQNPFGIGPYYDYVTYMHGIGYHSIILDDLARYGIWALVFYCAYFSGYYRVLKKEWQKIGAQHVALSVTFVYALLLLLNFGNEIWYRECDCVFHHTSDS